MSYNKTLNILIFDSNPNGLLWEKYQTETAACIK